jgi:hypothetical protein
LINLFEWQGKVFDSKAGLLRNRILPFGINAIVARVYVEPSWIDTRHCIVLDYSETSIVVQWIRDEICLISPGLFLGKVFWNHTRSTDFALQFSSLSPA